MIEQAETVGATSWRRRHPVLSRGLLYGVGGGLVLLAVVLLLRRQGVDRQDRFDYVAARLESLDLLAATDRTGVEVTKVLDEIFAEPDLPPDLYQQALRARAFNHLKRARWDEALADLDAAAGVAPERRIRQAIGLERAQSLILASRPDEAEAVLEALPEGPHAALGLWQGMLQAQVLDGRGRRDDAILRLDAILDGLPRPLPDTEALVVHQTAWTPAAAALQATVALADLLGPERAGVAPWERLLELAPRDLPTVLHAARALRQGGHETEAVAAWTHGLSLNDGRVLPEWASDPDLSALERIRVESLKAEAAGGR